MPVMYAAAGNCHVYVDADADLDMAVAIAVNAKVQRPACATRSRRCSSTPTSRRSSCRALLGELRDARRGAARRRRGRARSPGDARRLAARGDRGRLGHGVPRR